MPLSKGRHDLDEGVAGLQSVEDGEEVLLGEWPAGGECQSPGGSQKAEVEVREKHARSSWIHDGPLNQFCVQNMQISGAVAG